jgi:LemA protein
LKANELFKNLQTRISALETAIADRREIYNDAVNALNVRLESFPDVLIARPFAFTAAPMLRFSASQTSDIDLKPVFGG